MVLIRELSREYDEEWLMVPGLRDKREKLRMHGLGLSLGCGGSQGISGIVLGVPCDFFNEK